MRRETSRADTILWPHWSPLQIGYSIWCLEMLFWNLLTSNIPAFSVRQHIPCAPQELRTPGWFPHTSQCSPVLSLGLCTWRGPSAHAKRRRGGHASPAPCCCGTVLKAERGRSLRGLFTGCLGYPRGSELYFWPSVFPNLSRICLTSHFPHQRLFFVTGERQGLLLRCPRMALLLSKILLPPIVIFF